MPLQRLPVSVVQIAALVQLIASAQQGTLWLAPDWVGTPLPDHRDDVLVAKTRSFCKQGDVHTPFILRPAQGRDPTDDDLSLAQGQMAGVEQGAGKAALKQALVTGQRREQAKRWQALGHQPGEAVFNRRGVRRLGCCNPAWHR